MKAELRNDSRGEAVAKRAHVEWERGRNKRAFTLFQEAAALGAAVAQHNLGYFYDAGIGTKKDRRKALYWYTRAWRNDRQTCTCINIAYLYASQKNSRAAVLWWRKAIERGDGDAALDLAKFYLSKGSNAGKSEALALLKKVRKFRRVLEGSIEEADRILKQQKAKV